MGRENFWGGLVEQSCVFFFCLCYMTNVKHERGWQAEMSKAHDNVA